MNDVTNSGMIQSGVFAMPRRSKGTAFVDIADIADVVVAALTEPGHTSEVYEVTGSRLLTFEDVASTISEASTRDVAFVEVLEEAWLAAAVDGGEPPEVAQFLVELFGMTLDGRNASLCDGVQRALGRPPRDFVSYARSVAATGVWAGGALAAVESRDRPNRILNPGHACRHSDDRPRWRRTRVVSRASPRYRLVSPMYDATALRHDTVPQPDEA